MPRYEYRKLEQLPDASKAFDGWIEHLDREFANKDVTHRSEVVRDVLHELYLGRPYEAPRHGASLAEQTLIHSFDPRILHRRRAAIVRQILLRPEVQPDCLAIRQSPRCSK